MKKQYLADISLIFITAVWGISFPLMRNTIQSITNFQYLGLRFLIASFFLLVFFYKNLKFINKKILLPGFILGLFITLTLVFTILALNYTSSSNTAFISGLNIVIVPLITCLFMKEKIKPLTVLGIIFSLIGLILISGAINLSLKLGDFFALISALSISAHIYFTDFYIKKNNDSILLGVIQVNIAMFFLLILWVIEGSGMVELKTINVSIVFTILITGILGTAFAFVGQTYIQKYTSPIHVSIIFIFEPVFGAIFSFIIPDYYGNIDILSKSNIFGFFFVLIAMILIEINPKSKLINLNEL